MKERQSIDMKNDIFISSRVRLARNIDSFPFFLKDERAHGLSNTVFAVLKQMDKCEMYKMSEFDDIMAFAIMERHLISADLIKNKRSGAVIVGDDEAVSIMLNEEDHIREQCILKGLNLKQAYDRLGYIDRALAKELKFAYHKSYGYLTSCLTNLGTGLRASVMMFLPALALTKNIDDCLKSVARAGMVVRGVYGEGSEPSGFIYQVSNSKSLGITEHEIIESVELAAMSLAKAEQAARNMLIERDAAMMKDKIMRSYGILSHCHILPYSEFLSLVAFIKMGIYYGILSTKDNDALHDLIEQMGPASLEVEITNKKINIDKDIFRAIQVIKNLNKNIFVN